MSFPDYITRENFDQSFDLIKVLKKSVFYPSSGLDGTAIKMLTNKYFSFVHVDYETSEGDVIKAMLNRFEIQGCELIGIQPVPIFQITRQGLDPRIFLPDATEDELRRINNFPHLFYYERIRPFALWAVFELRTDRNNNPHHSRRFSLLHIGAEACITLKNVYEANGINPEVVVIIDPGEGYGENWTQYTNPEYRFYQTLINNANINHVPMPQKVISNWSNFFWPGYQYINTEQVPTNNHPYPLDKFEIYERS